MKLSSFPARFGFSALLSLLVAGQAFALEKYRVNGRAAANQTVEFEVYMPLQHTVELDQLLVSLHTPGSANYHKWLTPQQFNARFGPRTADVARVTEALKRYGLNVTRTHSHGVHVEGTVSNVENAFATSIMNGVSARGSRKLISSNALTLPAALTQTGAQVVHFSPVIRNRVYSHAKPVSEPENRKSPKGGYWFTDLKQAYGFPSYQSLTGKGVNIGILMSSDYNDTDMQLYFGHEGLKPPVVVRRPVLGGAAFDVNNNGGSVEVSLDLQQTGGMAPDATLYLYNIPDLSDQAIIAGYLQIVEENQADIVSSSFGGPEATYGPDYNNGQDFTGILQVYESLFKQGNAQGITFVASSGDNGALDLPPVEYFTTTPQNPPQVTGTYQVGVEWPAVSPSVTGVGGSNLITTYVPGSLESNYIRENADGDPLEPEDPYNFGNLIAAGYWGSGGGKSVIFPKPDYQQLVRTGSAKYRTVPDLSLHMGGCPVGSYQPCGPDRSYDYVYAGGNLYGVIGTSASAPDFAGLLALREQYVPGRIGNVNYVIYRLAQSQFNGTAPVNYFRTGVPGFNGFYHTHAGYNLVLGNGTLFGKEFIDAADLPAAGDPGTPSNP